MDPGVKVIDTYDPEQLGDAGRAHYFYHQRGEDLPIRDILQTQTDISKPEPCMERGAIGYTYECIPASIGSFADDPSERYLLFFTRVRNSDLDADGDQRFAGYLDKQRKFQISDPRSHRTGVQGKMHWVKLENGVPLNVIDSPNLRNTKCLTETETQEIVTELDRHPNVLEECLERIEECEAQVDRDRYWEQPSVEVQMLARE